jgi:hypothetical protein
MGMQGDMSELRESVIQLALQHAQIDTGAETGDLVPQPNSDASKPPQSVVKGLDWAEGGATHGAISSHAVGTGDDACAHTGARELSGVGISNEGSLGGAMGVHGGSREGNAMEGEWDDDDFLKLHGMDQAGGGSDLSENVMQDDIMDDIDDMLVAA